MGLFKKENCCLCGGKTGMLDKKCTDGKVCKECKQKLSVWFEDYKTSSANDLKDQLNQKENDLEKIKTLHFNKVFGEFGVILIDEEAKVFTAFADTSTSLFGNQRKVKSIDDVLDLRPDLIRFDQVEDIEIDITETSREEKRTVDGEQVSYDPPRFLYMESFTLRFKLNHPYIHSVYVPLNSGTIQIKNAGRRKTTSYGRKLAAYLLDMPDMVLEKCEAVYDNDSLIDWFYHSPYEMPAYSYGFKCSFENEKEIKKYHLYLLMARQIEQIIKGE